MSKTLEEIHKLLTSLWTDIQTPDSFPNNRPLLAHYTSIETLAQIMESNELWFSNPLFMNDWEELRVGMNEGLTAFRENTSVRSACRSPERYEILQSEYNRLYQRFDAEHAFDTYVFCLSKHDETMPDGLLSMWRGYGSNGNGAAIIFDTAKINFVNESPLTIHYVSYASKDTRIKTINKKLDEFAKLLSDNHIDNDKLALAAYMIFNRLKTEAIFTKHHGFKEEQEWRAVYLREFDFNKKFESMLHYSLGKRGIEPRLKFKVQPTATQPGINVTLEQIVHKIILGPSISNPLALMSIRRMLEKVGKASLGTKLSASSTPFRP